MAEERLVFFDESEGVTSLRDSSSSWKAFYVTGHIEDEIVYILSIILHVALFQSRTEQVPVLNLVKFHADTFKNSNSVPSIKLGLI